MAELRIRRSLLTLDYIFSKPAVQNILEKITLNQQRLWQVKLPSRFSGGVPALITETSHAHPTSASTVPTHAQLKRHSSTTFCLVSMFPVVSSNSFSPNTAISATPWFTETWSRVLQCSTPPHCYHWGGPGFESFLGSGSKSRHLQWAVVSRHLQSAADFPLSPARSGRQWSTLLLCLAPRSKGKRRSPSLWDLLSPCVAYTCWIYLMSK